MNKQVPQQRREELMRILKTRFEKNKNRHVGLDWASVQAKIEANLDKMWSLNEMEETEGEPDVIGYDAATDEYIFVDCSAESPKGRRSFCYDRAALDARKEHKPANNALEFVLAQECLQMISFMISKEKCMIERVLGVFKIQVKGRIFHEPGFIRIYPETPLVFVEGDIVLMDLNCEFKKGFVMELLEFIEMSQRIYKQFYGKECTKSKMVFLFNNFDYVTAKRELKGYEEGLGGRVGIYYFALEWLGISLERRIKEMEEESKKLENQLKKLEVLIDEEKRSEFY